MVTPASSCAFGSTIAVGWIVATAAPSGDSAHRAEQLGLASDVLADHGTGLVLVDARAGAFQADFHHKLVAWFHRPLEAGAVDTREVDDGICAGLVALGGERQQRR